MKIETRSTQNQKSMKICREFKKSSEKTDAKIAFFSSVFVLCFFFFFALGCKFLLLFKFRFLGKIINLKNLSRVETKKL